GAERFERYLDALLGGGRPSPDDVADRDEAEMARLAAELSAAADPAEGEPDPAFVDQLRRRMRQADVGIATVQEPLPLRPSGAQRGRVAITRRQLLQAGVIGAAGVAAGAAGIVLLRPEQAPRDWIWDDGSGLVGPDGEWVQVATVGDVPAGSAVRFSTSAFDGYVVNDNGQIRALGAVCTHMGCSLQVRADHQDLRCPCHGASFDLAGTLANGRDRWRSQGPYPGDARAYPIELPDLVKPQVKVDGDRVLVWTAKENPAT
ncbi:MAG TPA: Rieske 2Fe-2S domain-containing protein, partial [Candidatus Limnocylindria bacterium]|nr:Rieske 2Fe-2S domain-containing protein [Candidatus Limnocylindria bacterium]